MVLVTSKRLAALSSVLLAVTLLGAYAAREHRDRPRSIARDRLAQISRAGSIYLLRRGEHPVGISRLLYQPMGDSLLVMEDTELRLPAPGGAVQQAVQHAEQVLDAELTLIRFTVRVATGSGPAAQRTVVRGARTVQGDSLALTIETGGRAMTVVQPASRALVLGAGLWPRLAYSGALTPGARLAVEEFDPTTLTVRALAVDVGTPRRVAARSLLLADEDDHTVAATDSARLVPLTQSVGGVVTQLELTDDALPVTAALPLGIAITRAGLDDVQQLRRTWARGDIPGGAAYAFRADSSTVIGQSAIAAGATVHEARTAQRLVLAIGGMDLPAHMDGATQQQRGDTLIVTRAALPSVGGAGYLLAADGTPALSLRGDTALTAALVAEPFIEADHPIIRDAARTILAGERDPVRATTRLVAAVYDRLEKSYTASIPSAIEVWRAGAGDCNEHTVLFTALARAAGIPARPVSGVVFVNDAFYFHAWVEVYLGGRWVPVDPTFGLAPADPARVRLAIGRAHLNEALAALGRLSLTVVSRN